MRFDYHLRKMIPILLEGLCVGAVFLVALLVAMQLFVEWMQ